MKRVSSIKDSMSLINRIRDYKKGFETNLYSLPELWFNKGLLFTESHNEAVFIFKKNPDFFNLYYCASDKTALREGLIHLDKLYPKETFVADIIGGNEIFADNGFNQYSTLIKMSHPELEQDFELDPLLRPANINDIEEIQRLFYRHFDKYTERLPLDEEIKEWISKGSIYVYCEDQILGFVIFDLFPLKSYLRYWFVHSEHRDKGIGSMLLNQFFYDSRKTKRQILWVISDNENAIKRYEHYGFTKENLTNYVYIRKGN